MKKITLLTILFLIFSQIPTFAINFGMYKSESDYGLIDGFKWNLFKREPGQPMVQLRSEIPEEQVRLEKEKARPKDDQAEVQMYRFMLEDTVAF